MPPNQQTVISGGEDNKSNCLKQQRKATKKRRTMTSTTMANLTWALVLLCSFASISGEATTTIRDYRPQNDVSAFLGIGSDLQAIDQALSLETEEGFQQALSIYEKGAYSDPYTQISIPDGLPFDLPEGTSLTGTNNDGRSVKVTVAFGSYKKGDYKIQIAFRSSDSPCRFSGIPVPELDGCLVSDGNVTAPGQTESFGYSYMLDEIKNYHQIKGFTANAQSKFRAKGNTHVGYFKDFQKNVDFFGAPDFADQIIMAAFERSVYQGQYNFALDFTQLSPQARRSVILHMASYMVVSQFVLRELETAIVHCDHRCGASGCNKDSIHSLDGAVALYTGAVFQQNGKGNLMYGLADKMCAKFRTCESSSTSGTSNVNTEIFRYFNEMQSFLDSSQCLEAKVNKEKIARQIFVPLLQAALLAIQMDEEMDTMESRAERVMFSTSLLPLMHHCDPTMAQEMLYLADAVEPISSKSFSKVKIELESEYRCLAVTCQDVGGLWDPETGDYVEGAESCYVPESDVVDDITDKLFLDAWYMYVLALSALGLVIFCIMRQSAQRRRRLRELDDDDVDSDSDDEYDSDEFSDDRPW